MSKRYYLPGNLEAFVFWLSNFILKLKPLATLLGVSPRELEQTEADHKFVSFACDAKNQYAAKAKDLTAFCNILQKGGQDLVLPQSVQLPEAPPMVPAGVADRVTGLVHRIKHHPAYNDAIGHDLGIIGPEQSVDFNSVKPQVRVSLQDGRPVLRWKKNRLDGAELIVDRGSGTFERLAVCTKPRFTDQAPLPSPGTGAVWKYKVIYRDNDKPVGQWSDIASVGVFG